MANFKRLKQVWRYARIHSKEFSACHGVSSFRVFVDMLRCYFKYNMWTNEYVKEDFFVRRGEERFSIGAKYKESGMVRDSWHKEFVENRKFLNKWSAKKMELPKYRARRNAAYTQRYGMGTGCFVEYDVEFSRQHYLNGSLTIGNNVLFAKHVFVDYSGTVVIEDGVKFGNGVIVESHHRDIDAYNNGKDVNIPTRIVISEGAYIGSRAMILDSCNYIGKRARVGAGAVVTRDVPDFAVVGGVPARVIRML